MKRMQETLYLDRGWSVLPLEPRAKLPATSVIRKTRGTSSWKTFAARHASPDEIAAWAELEPAHNVGILCGETSGNLAVVDVDTGLPADVTVPFTATARTGRGKQFYASSDTPATTTRFEWGELRGEGSYCVAPESLHPNGRRYEWETHPDEGIASLTEFSLAREHQAKPENLSSLLSTNQPLSGLLGFAFATCPTPETADAYAAVLGLPFERLGKAFECVLHPEAHPSATLWPHRQTGELLFHDFHARDREWVWLPTLYAWLSGHSHESLSRSAYVTWAKRLDIEAGVAVPASVARADLPADAPPGLRQLYDGFLRLFEARWLYSPGEPAPFSHRFAAVWCCCAKATVEKHFPELRRLGLARYAGRDARGTSLWLPGEGVRPLRVRS
jgi:Bifunctional DNA primase/polymerase, N-terminal